MTSAPEPPQGSISIDDLAREKLNPATVDQVDKVVLDLRFPGVRVNAVMSKRAAQRLGALIVAVLALTWGYVRQNNLDRFNHSPPCPEVADPAP